MNAVLHCPNCHAPVDPDERLDVCLVCDAPLGLAAPLLHAGEPADTAARPGAMPGLRAS